ncbi:MAG: fused MFS/spermidine synthase [Chloroflexi bacterium]|nr:fused MFS/spermidine synthase [Chloroflexota bacterium]
MTDILRHPRLQLRFLYLAVFTGGMTTLAVELSAARLLGNVYGTSNMVWANIIGLILIYLTIGYFIGGKLADRFPYPRTFYQVVAWAAFFSGLVPLFARPILRAAATAVQDFNAAGTVGSFISVLVLFAVPITLLGCISPFAIRLALADVDRAGNVSGRMYAISTLGSIIGNFAPVLILIPQVGTARTFLIFAGLLLAVGLGGLALHDRRAALKLAWMPLVLLVLAILLLRGPLRPPPSGMTQLYEDESPYNLVQVVEDEQGYRYLLLNEGQGIHSQWHPTEIYYARTWGMFLAGPYFNAPPYSPDRMERIAIIGLAAGTIARQHDAIYPGLPMDGIEIDPGIVEAGRQTMGMTMPNLNVIIEDGRYALGRLEHDYTMIGIDAYRVPYVPWHLTTVEFFQEVRDHLTDDGVVIINVGHTRTDRRLIEAMGRTLLDVFPTVHTIDVPGSYNTILVVTRQPTESGNLQANLDALPADVHPVLREALQTAVSGLRPTVISDLRFTDDHAPVEAIVDSMVIEFVLEGGINELTD